MNAVFLNRCLLYSAVLFFCIGGVITAPAQAQLFSDEAARDLARKNSEDIRNVQALLRDLNDNIEKARAQAAELTQKNQKLEAQARALNGKIEELEQQITSVRNEDTASQRAEKISQSKKIGTQEKKIVRLEITLATLQERLDEISQFVTLPPEDQLYAEAYADYQKQDFANAILRFKRVLRFYPNGQFSANSLYWLGQAHLVQEDYVSAHNNARMLLDNHPDSNRIPEALLTLAKSFQGMKRLREADDYLRQLIEQHPTSLAADAARQLLTQQ